MDLAAKGNDFEKKAEKKLNGWGSRYIISAYDFIYLLLEKAGSTYVKLGQCHLKLDSKHEAASAYVDAAHCYKKTSTTDIQEPGTALTVQEIAEFVRVRCKY
ncbi:hypothetical protein NC651_020013 [Populus alba x Populus x berolinensis]|nr:hypothetical protein NC651_020013 [Populus alba x Populus x berolinensis]